jgi:hypothetical protein
MQVNKRMKKVHLAVFESGNHLAQGEHVVGIGLANMPRSGEAIVAVAQSRLKT